MEGSQPLRHACGEAGEDAIKMVHGLMLDTEPIWVSISS